MTWGPTSKLSPLLTISLDYALLKWQIHIISNSINEKTQTKSTKSPHKKTIINGWMLNNSIKNLQFVVVRR